MHSSKFLPKSKINKNFLILIAGVIITVLSLIITDVRGSCDGVHSPTFLGCAEDADIGWYLLTFFGIFVVLVGVTGLCAEALSKLPSRLGDEARYAATTALVAGLTLIIIGILTAPLQNRTEVEKLYKCSSINYKTGETIYPAGYNYENFSENSHCQNLKGAPEAKISYINTAVFSGIVLFLAGGIGIATSIKPRKR